jgi:hypothetical protein
MLERIQRIQRAGLEVSCGMIVGFIMMRPRFSTPNSIFSPRGIFLMRC